MAQFINSYPSVRSYTDKGFKNQPILRQLRGLTVKQLLRKEEEPVQENPKEYKVPSEAQDMAWAGSASQRFQEAGYAVEYFFLSLVTKQGNRDGSLAKRTRTLRKEAQKLAKKRNTVKAPTKVELEQAILMAMDLDLDSDVEFMSEWLIKAYK